MPIVNTPTVTAGSIVITTYDQYGHVIDQYRDKERVS